MSKEKNVLQTLTSFTSLQQVSSSLLKSIAEVFDVNTVYLAQREPNQMNVLDAYNLREDIVQKGMLVPYKESYGQFVMEDGDMEFTSLDLTSDERTMHIEIGKKLGLKTFVGAGLFDREGNPFGTLCLVDTVVKDLGDQEISLFKHIAGLLSYLISLDQANERIELLSTPVVPIFNGIVVLPLIGIFDEHRIDSLTNKILQYCFEHNVDYFLLDLSGISNVEKGLFVRLRTILDSFLLMGVTPVLTGIRPDMALSPTFFHEGFSRVMTKPSVELALQELGFVLEK
ncbi:STAS domain-containing protein [Radiobacillus deserti]|uniref:STAS domain-containing protein n=1 Tax=Radiobacillus deserti TaxID=2594883 RepID=A0A516KJ75_9BACI|nr:STAS domain-containing protein [Radiobacillus deserti]QDP41432.1 STAS domain-containing protein [Radiobacillus deserti]